MIVMFTKIKRIMVVIIIMTNNNDNNCSWTADDVKLLALL